MLCAPRPPRACFACDSYSCPAGLSVCVRLQPDAMLSISVRLKPDRLITIPGQRLFDRLGRGGREHRRAAQVAGPLLRHPRGQVAGAGRAMLHLAGRRSGETASSYPCVSFALAWPRSRSENLEFSENPISYCPGGNQKRGTGQTVEGLAEADFRKSANKTPTRRLRSIWVKTPPSVSCSSSRCRMSASYGPSFLRISAG